MRAGRILIALALSAAAAAGCKGGKQPPQGPPQGGGQAYEVAVRTDGVPADKVSPLVDGAVALLRRRLELGGCSSFGVERQGDRRIRLTVPAAGCMSADDLRVLVRGEASLAFRVEASVEGYRGAVYPRKAPQGYRWFTKPVDPKDVIEGVPYRILAEEKPAVDGSGVVLAEASPSSNGIEVVITLTPIAMAALQAALARPSRGARVAVTVNDVVVAMPQLGSRFEGSDVSLSGGYDDARAQAIVAGLNAAVVPRHLDLLTEQTLGPPSTGAARQ